MDHLSELGHATIKHHLVTDMTCRRPVTSQPSQNKTTITPFLFSSAHVLYLNFPLDWTDLKAIEFRRRLNTSRSDQVEERKREKGNWKIHAETLSNAERLSWISREDTIMCQKETLTAQEGQKNVEKFTQACWESTNQITVSDFATLVTLSARLRSKGLHICKNVRFHYGHLALKEVGKKKTRARERKWKRFKLFRPQQNELRWQPRRPLVSGKKHGRLRRGMWALSGKPGKKLMFSLQSLGQESADSFHVLRHSLECCSISCQLPLCT